MGQLGERTNFASEFFVLSQLNRMELEPLLTLGNKKAIDIFFQRGKKSITIDVKGMRSKSSWLLGVNELHESEHHYYVLVTYLGKFNETEVVPECYIVPSKAINKLKKETKKGYAIGYALMKSKGRRYLNNWKVFNPNMELPE